MKSNGYAGSYAARCGLKGMAAVRRLIGSFFDPVKMIRSFREFPAFIIDIVRYARAAGIHIRMRDLYPVLGQKGRHEFDAHYIYLNAWAARRIVACKPVEHVDVGSQLSFVTVLSATLPIKQVEFRSFVLPLSDFDCIQGSILQLPFRDGSVYSLSCLHVIEHVGLGRYGDPIDPQGSIKAAKELARVLAPKGQLLIGLPMGRPRICFNAHRIHDSLEILSMFSGLKLLEFSGVDDLGQFDQDRPLDDFDHADYSCGFFRFTRE